MDKFKCPYEHCEANTTTVLFYRYKPGRYVSYECRCRACKRAWTKSIKLESEVAK